MTAIKPAERPQTAPSLEEDYALLKKAAREAGELALTYFRKSIIVKRKIDGSEVSEADLALDVALKLALHAPRPDYGWLSEETEDDPERLKHRRVWMVDPIDGTNAFLRHVPEWTVSAALVEDGVPVLGVVFNPATKEFFHAMRGKGAFLNDKPIAASTKSTLDGALLIASGGLFKKKIWKEPWPEVKTRWVNSVAYRLALVACGGGRRHHLALGQVRMGPRRRRADRRGGRRHRSPTITARRIAITARRRAFRAWWRAERLCIRS